MYKWIYLCKGITHNEDKFPNDETNQEPQCCHHGFENLTKEERLFIQIKFTWSVDELLLTYVLRSCSQMYCLKTYLQIEKYRTELEIKIYILEFNLAMFPKCLEG